MRARLRAEARQALIDLGLANAVAVDVTRVVEDGEGEGTADQV